MKFIMIDTMIMMGARDTENLPNFDTVNYQKLQDEWFEKEVASCESTYCIVVEKGSHKIFTYGLQKDFFKLILCFDYYK